MSNIMLDIETLGIGADAVMLSLGAVKFNAEGVYETFYANIDPQTCVAAGLKMDVPTVLWWMRRDEQARAVFTQPAQSLSAALSDFINFCLSDAEAGTVKLWGNGASFDNVILSTAYRKLGIEQPWKFWNDRCYRTVKALRPDIKIERVGVHHHALHDAESQALHLIRLAQALDIEL